MKLHSTVRYLLPVVSLVALSTLASGCRGGDKFPAAFPLRWQGTSDIAPDVKDDVREGLRRYSFRVAPVQDRRANPNVVGADMETGRQFTTTTNVAEYTTKFFESAFVFTGAKVVSSGETALITVELLEFDVAEGGMFNGVVRMNIHVTTPDGRTVWEGFAEGKSKRWGSSHSSENVNEALSSALKESMENWLKTPAFLDALRGNAPPPR